MKGKENSTMIKKEKLLIERVNSFIIDELVTLGQKFVKTYYRSYEMNNELKQKLIDDPQFNKYLADYMENTLFRAMIELLPEKASYKKIVVNVLFDFKTDPFWINKVLKKM